MASEQVTPEQAEAYVRAAWLMFPVEQVYDEWGPLSLWKFRPDGKYRPLFKSYSEAVLAAYVYTKEQERKIAEKREEMVALKKFGPGEMWYDPNEVVVFGRILVILESQLADLLRGFKVQP